MVYDREITISTGASRKSTNWQAQRMRVSDLYNRLCEPQKSSDTLSEYLSFPKGKQDDLKDVGGFVAGELKGPRRKATAVQSREIITLDFDNIPARGTETVLGKVESLGVGYCIYSTRKHREAAPRLRVLLPIDRTVTADEFEPIARKAAEFIGMDMADPTTFETHRLMYWPSICADGDYIYRVEDKPFLSADFMLGLYANWRDAASWPKIPGAKSTARLAAKQGDPETKPGIVGAFCRTYDIPKAMEKYLPGVYEAVDEQEGRYTFLGGSTTGGAVLYDNGKFMFSHHATDPCSNTLVNAFDLVRLHRFGDLDDTAPEGTVANHLPSFKAMQELAAGDNAVSSLRLKERRDDAEEAFKEVPGDEWVSALQKHPKTGLPLPTLDNICIILENDPNLKGLACLNEFTEMLEVFRKPPWFTDSEKHRRRAWKDADSAGLCWYLEKFYCITGRNKIEDALALHGERHSFHELLDYLNGLDWDGTPRLDTLFIDYLGADDNEYTRAVTRKSFVAAVARIMKPGIKFDCMTVLVGGQGIGKSTTLGRMAKGWFTDNLRTFEGKDAAEIIQGVWLVEVGEMGAFRKSDDARIKQFLSQREDRYRAAYGRHVKERKRQCVFFGTVNDYTFLRDHTGNRRFWPVDCDAKKRTKSPFEGEGDDLGDCIDQIWAEAVYKWKHGETLFLPQELYQSAEGMQEEHRERNVREGMILAFLEREVPEDWQKWDLSQRRVFWSGGATGDLVLVPRDRVCAVEIWLELFEGTKKELRTQDSKEINNILAKAPGWDRAKAIMRYGYCGPQRGFIRGA